MRPFSTREAVVIRQIRSERRSRRLLLWSMLLLVPSLVLTLGLGVLEVFVVGWTAGLILAAAGLCWRIFGVFQIRLLELVFVIGLLGNVGGWMLGSVFRDRRHISDEDMMVLVYTMLAASIWILAATSAALAVARKRRLEDPLKRLGLFAIYLVYPGALVAQFIAPIVLFFGVLHAEGWVSAISAAVTITSHFFVQIGRACKEKTT